MMNTHHWLKNALQPTVLVLPKDIEIAVIGRDGISLFKSMTSLE